MSTRTWPPSNTRDPATGAYTSHCNDCLGGKAFGTADSHPQTHLRVGAQAACVDVGWADVVELLWSLGIRTYDSCQATTNTLHTHRSGHPYLGFSSAEDLETAYRIFATVVEWAGDVRLRTRMDMVPQSGTYEGDGTITWIEEPREGHWRVLAFPMPWFVMDMPPVGEDGQTRSVFCYRLEMTPEDLDRLGELCRRYPASRTGS